MIGKSKENSDRPQVTLLNLHELNLFHPKYSVKEKAEYFVSKIKRGAKSKRGKALEYGKALDKPELPKSSTPNSSPEVPVKKKARREIFPEESSLPVAAAILAEKPLPESNPVKMTKPKPKKVKNTEPTRKPSRNKN